MHQRHAAAVRHCGEHPRQVVGGERDDAVEDTITAVREHHLVQDGGEPLGPCARPSEREDEVLLPAEKWAKVLTSQ